MPIDFREGEGRERKKGGREGGKHRCERGTLNVASCMRPDRGWNQQHLGAGNDAQTK